MLYSVDSGRYVKQLPHQADFDRWMKRLSASDYQKIADELNARVDTQEINTAGWIPGNNWKRTVFEPLYFACNQNEAQSGMFFGLLLFDLLMRREDRVWGFGRFEKNGVPINSITYFAIENPPRA